MIFASADQDASRKRLVAALYAREEAFLGLDDVVELSVGIPRYVLSRAARFNLDRLLPSSWDHLAFGANGVALVSLVRGPEEEFAEVVLGELPKLILSAFRLAEQRLGPMPALFRPALLEGSGAGLLWLVFTAKNRPARVIDLVNGAILSEAQLRMVVGLSRLRQSIGERWSPPVVQPF